MFISKLNSLKARILEVVPAKLIGAAFMMSWALLFSTAMAFSKTLHPDVHSLVILFMRCLFGFMIFSPFALKMGLAAFKTNRPLLHLLRVCFMCSAMACTYYAYRNLPLATATSIGMTGPLFTTMLAMLILRDNVSLQKWGVILLGYVGVLVVVRPHEIEITPAIWVEILANIFAACTIICVKLLSKTEETVTIMMYATSAAVIVSGLAAVSVWQPPSYEDILTLVAIGALGVSSQFCSVTALKFANPSYLSPFEYTRLCFAIPVGFFFFEEVPTLWVLAGSLIIILATTLLTKMEMKT
ncbi:DMT family transporter [Candidatus Bealeia paramacronuclearis]|uniref:DMT family transporter n=1 Tax=Candidatus Bealeia paramacronuclearis TaxID=1921001 RepID=A0ABZ2C8J9_9PROT|nr:DMT family transporter [Candidatus Bealeia paramacronuclearis]